MAFVTGDLFNLYVGFEILLAASYALLLHGTGLRRVASGLHYIVINLIASLLFLPSLDYATIREWLGSPLGAVPMDGGWVHHRTRACSR